MSCHNIVASHLELHCLSFLLYNTETKVRKIGGKITYHVILLFLKKQQNFKLSSAASYRLHFKG